MFTDADKTKARNQSLKESDKGITIDRVERNKVKSSTSTMNKGSCQYPSDGEVRKLEEPGCDKTTGTC